MPTTLAGLLELGVEQAFGYGIGGALTPLVEVETQPLRNELWAAQPSLPLDPIAAAQAAVKFPGRYAHYEAEARKNGIDAGNFRALVEVANQAPGAALLLELWNRGLLDEAAVEAGLRDALVPDPYVDALKRLRHRLLSPAELAAARQQGFVTRERHHHEAALQGVDAERAELQYDVVGLPPGIETGLELLRRRLIDEERFAQIVREGHTKTKYTADLLKLRHRPLSAATAAMLLLRERIPRERALEIAEENGMRRDDFLHWSSGLGRPPGVMTALQLVRRRVLGDPEGARAKAFFREVVARSDVRVEYADELFELRHVYPSLFQISRMLAAGTVDDKLAHETLLREGYTPAWAQALVKGSHRAKRDTHKHVPLSAVERLYDAGVYDHPHALEAVGQLGYDDEAARDLLRSFELRSEAGGLHEATTRVRIRYVDWKIDEPTARAELHAVGLDGPQVERLFQRWRPEREATRPVLTPSQVVNGFFYGRYDYVEAEQRLVRLGYSGGDALTLLWIRAHGDPRPPELRPPAAA